MKTTDAVKVNQLLEALRYTFDKSGQGISLTDVIKKFKLQNCYSKVLLNNNIVEKRSDRDINYPWISIRPNLRMAEKVYSAMKDQRKIYSKSYLKSVTSKKSTVQVPPENSSHDLARIITSQNKIIASQTEEIEKLTEKLKLFKQLVNLD